MEDIVPLISGKPPGWIDASWWERNREWIAVFVICALSAVGVVSAIVSPPFDPGAGDAQKSGWGIMACLTRHVEPGEVAPLLQTLAPAKLSYLRELWISSFGIPGRPVGPEVQVLEQLKRAGYRTLALAEDEQKPASLKESLTGDLRTVYQQARRRAALFGGLVSVWEMPNEADLSVKEPPDRAVAYEKAMYLGLKDGAALQRPGSTRSGVLMGALAFYPGPWLERAAKNGLFDYTDGLNMHFYGLASDLGDVIRAQRGVVKRYVRDRELPVWITECGVDAVPRNDLDEARGREIQRKFTVETARIADQEKVAAFFPFIFVWPGSSFAMVRRDGSPYPAWNAYADYTRRHSDDSRPALIPPKVIPRVVLQWNPDYRTCVSNKVSGTYWFKERQAVPQPVKGELRFYNFSAGAMRGKMTMSVPKGFEISTADDRQITEREIDIPAMGMMRLPVQCTVPDGRYRRGEVKVSFISEGAPGVESQDSRLVFGLETRPMLRRLPATYPVQMTRPTRDGFSWIWAPEPYVVSSQRGSWLGLNGVRILGAGSSSSSAFTSFSVPGASVDPRLPPMAVTRVNGLPSVGSAFLHLHTGPDSEFTVSIRVDLIDKHGERFAILENFGKNWFTGQLDDTYLAYDDFQIYIWGRCLENPRFRPEDIREIQLRFYSPMRTSVDVRMEVVAPK